MQQVALLNLAIKTLKLLLLTITMHKQPRLPILMTLKRRHLAVISKMVNLIMKLFLNMIQQKLLKAWKKRAISWFQITLSRALSIKMITSPISLKFIQFTLMNQSKPVKQLLKLFTTLMLMVSLLHQIMQQQLQLK